jgi:hypothetical protein
VAGVGKERHGMRQHAVRRLHDDEADVEQRGYGKGRAEGAGRMAMATVVTVVMVVTMGVMWCHAFDSCRFQPC